MNAICRLPAGILAVALVLTVGAPAHAQRSEPPAPRNSPKMLAAFRPIVSRPALSTVRVLSDGKDCALGTVVSADGLILTRASDLKGKLSCEFRDGKEYPARVLGIEPKTDLALLKVEAKGLTPIEWRDSKSASAGAWLASPGMGQDPAAIGVVSVATRTPSGLEQRMMGGPIVPANAGFLGVGLEADEKGPKISQVVPDGPAAKAGMKTGDIVLTVGGKKVANPDQLVKLIQSFKPGDQVTMKVMREEEEMELKARLDKRPGDRADFQNRMGSALSNRRGGYPTILQHDSVIKPTDCGGPIVDLDGKAVGINISRAGRVETFAIPSEVVQGVLPDLMSGKLAPKEEEVAAIETPKAKPKVEKPKNKVEAAEYAVKEAEEELAQARERGDRREIRAARQKLAEARTAFEKLKGDK